MNKFTANYSYSNHNLVIQNLEGQRINKKSAKAVSGTLKHGQFENLEDVGFPGRSV